jgi:RNase P subunit RPR2
MSFMPLIDLMSYLYSRLTWMSFMSLIDLLSYLYSKSFRDRKDIQVSRDYTEHIKPIRDRKDIQVSREYK